MSREYVYFLSHPPIGSLCRLGSLCSLGSFCSLPSIYGLIQQEKSPQKKRSCSQSQQRTLRPFSIHLGHTTHDQHFFGNYLPGMHVRVWSSACYSAYENGRMVVAGGRPTVVIESAVARCQLRHYAPFFMDSLPFVSCEKNKYACVEQNAKKNKKKTNSTIVF